MTIGDIRYTVLQTVNEVMEKLGLDTVSSLTSNKVSRELVKHINDVVDDLSDFGNWMEVLATTRVTAQVSVRDYYFTVSGVVKNVGDIYLSNKRGPLQSVDIQEMRIMTRATAMGQPTQFCIFGTDTNGQPIIRVRPTPDASQDGQLFSILYYKKPSLYTTADAATVIPFPSRVVVLGVLAAYTLRESGGAETPMYQMFYKQYLEKRREAYNRFNGATGWDVSYVPNRGGGFKR
jgi:hypothetical protein